MLAYKIDIVAVGAVFGYVTQNLIAYGPLKDKAVDPVFFIVNVRVGGARV